MKYALIVGESASTLAQLGITSTTPFGVPGGFQPAGDLLNTDDLGVSWFTYAGVHPLTQLKVAAIALPAVAIPTVEFWSLSVLGLLVAGFGVRRMQQQRGRGG